MPIWIKLLLVFLIGLAVLLFMIWKWSVPENKDKVSLWSKSTGGRGGPS